MNNTLRYIKHIIDQPIDTGIIAGSGLSAIQDILDNVTKIPYSDIPNYFNTTVKGHEGQFIFGHYNNKNILIASGRFHYYEGLSINEVGLPIQIFHDLGCKQIIITNSSGCLVPAWNLGDIMVVNGHYDFTFRSKSANPSLIQGNNYYNQKLVDLVLDIKPELRLGKYGWVLGPAYETRSEIQNMITHGVQAVGMSTIPEVMMAHKLGINILVLALMSNYAVGLTQDELTHEKVLINSKKYNQNFQLLLISILSKI
tara:strand:+ start:101 stop:868 length:768 start_codon:yes stop_codon:yes gene_type:complete